MLTETPQNFSDSHSNPNLDRNYGIWNESKLIQEWEMVEHLLTTPDEFKNITISGLNWQQMSCFIANCFVTLAQPFVSVWNTHA